MNTVDDTKETNNHNVQDEMEEDEGFDKSSDVEEKKRIVNELNAQGNTAYTQIFVQNLGNLNANYKPSLERFNTKESLKKYDLRNPDECSEFVETYKKSGYLAIAIILCTFEVVPLVDLPDLQEKLLGYLPVVEISDSEGLEKHPTQSNSYISLNTILTVIGGQKFVTEEGQSCAGLGENSKQALINIIEQFPFLRSAIVSWLIHTHEIQKYRTTFNACQIAVAFSRIISIDVKEANNEIFAQLYSNPHNIWLLGFLAYKLYENAELRADIETLIVQWINSDSRWLWKSACLAYVFLRERCTEISFETILLKAINKKIKGFKSADSNFISTLLIRSSHFRTLIANSLCMVYKKQNTREEKVALAQLYINIIRHSYYLVNSVFNELPLVACDTKQQQMSLCQILLQIMSTYHLRNQLYAIMEAYLKELSRYDFSVSTINHISAFFYNMSFTDLSYQNDVIFFLEKCKNIAAKQIYSQLCRTYKRGELHLHE